MTAEVLRLRAAQRAALKRAILTEDEVIWAIEFGNPISDKTLEHILEAIEKAHPDDLEPEAIEIPLAYYEWLGTIEKDTRVHDLTPQEITSLLILSKETKS